MRSYTVAVAAVAIGVPTKWLDNLLAQHSVAGVISERQRGVARRITHSALLDLALVAELNRDLGLSVDRSLAIAEALGSAPGVHAQGHLRLSVDRPGLERSVAARLGEALESVPTPRRGRPPRRALRG